MNEDLHLAFGDLLEDLIDSFSDLFEGEKLLEKFTYFFCEFGVSERFRFEQFLFDGIFVVYFFLVYF